MTAQAVRAGFAYGPRPDPVTGLILAREYRRVSKDRSGRERSVGQQHDENADHAAQQGWTLGEPYEDNDRSASEYATRTRDDFARLVEDVERDRFGAQVLILWEGSRLSRQMIEWVPLMHACKRAGICIYITQEWKVYDPRNGADWKALMNLGTDAESESWKVSQRVNRDVRANAAAGRPHGPTPYGYRRTRDERTGKVRDQLPDDESARIVVEIFERIARGDALRAICADLNARHIPTQRASEWTPGTLRVIVKNHAYIGERTHVAGLGKGDRQSALRRGLSAEYIPAVWDALVSRELFYAANAVLEGRYGTHPGRGVHLLSGIAVCDVCETRLDVRARTQTYRCVRGHVSVSKRDLDEVAEAAILDYLRDPELDARMSEQNAEDVSDELASVRGRIGELRARMKELESSTLPVKLLEAQSAKTMSELADAEERERTLTAPPALSGLIKRGPSAPAQWQRANMRVKRQIARIVLAPGQLGQLRLTRSPGGRVPAEDRIRWR